MTERSMAFRPAVRRSGDAERVGDGVSCPNALVLLTNSVSSGSGRSVCLALSGLGALNVLDVSTAPCGCADGATVDKPERADDVASFVAEAIRRGCTVERILVEDARQRLQQRRCFDVPKGEVPA